MDPYSFVSGCPKFRERIFFSFLVIIFYRRERRGPSSARQRNAIEMAYRWRTDDGVIFQRVGRTLCPDPFGSTHEWHQLLSFLGSDSVVADSVVVVDFIACVAMSVYF